MNRLFDISGQVVAITGGTGVLGRCISKYLAAEGAKVVILARNEETGLKVVDDIERNGGEAVFMRTDVMDKALLERNLDAVLSRYGRVDALLNAAGGNMPGATIPPDKTFFDLNTDDFRRVMELNLMGTVLPTQVFLRPMAVQKSGLLSTSRRCRLSGRSLVWQAMEWPRQV